MSLQRTKKGAVGLAVLPLLMTAQAHAIKGGEPGTIMVNGGMFYPSVGIGLTYDDNIFLTNTNKKSSTVLVVAPKARLEYDAGEATQMAFEVGMERGVYFSSSDDNYLDVTLSGAAAYLPTERLTLYGRLGYDRGHEARGTGNTAGAPTAVPEPDRFHVWTGEVRLGYGIADQKLEFGYIHEQRKYDNNRTTTILQDRKSNAVSAGVSMRVAPNTAMTLDLDLKKLDYDVATLDSTEWRGLVGVRWEATYQTAGFAKAGWKKKNMSSAALNDASGVSWEVGVDWRPLSYSSFQLSTARDFGESDGVGSYQDTRSLGLAWQHDWTDVIGTRLSLDAANIDYGGSTREDHDRSLGLKVEYRARPWLLFGASLLHKRQDSNTAGLDYRDNQIGVQVGINM